LLPLLSIKNDNDEKYVTVKFPSLQCFNTVNWVTDNKGIHIQPTSAFGKTGLTCLEGKRENYQVCSVQYCAQHLCTVQCTHIWTDLTVLWNGFCLPGPILLCLDSFLYMYYWMQV